MQREYGKKHKKKKTFTYNKFDTQNNNGYIQTIENLPVNKVEKELLDKLEQNHNLIVISETGSGKTTVIPRLVMEKYTKNHGCIVCTQPRRVAAISIAHHVAKCVGHRVGTKVGYIVRYEDVTCDDTSLIFATDGSLLRESISDPYLLRYSHIIIDEAHERSLHTDILFGVVKNAQQIRLKESRNPLKIIIMSATINAEKYEDFFNAETFFIDGRQYPIDIFYMKKDPIDYFNACFNSTIQLHKELPIEYGILLFLTGQEEIESMKELLIDFCTNNNLPKTEVYSLYAALSAHNQMKVFNNTAKDCRKIILATNIAETSITIPGINCVIDSGVVKIKRFCANSNIESLTVTPVSRSQARQRTGRAGRLGYGYCYRLFSEYTFFNKLNEETTPEILRCNLSYVCLVLISMGITNVNNFMWFDCPNTEVIRASLEKLKSLGAVDKYQNLTDLGKLMIKFPVDPIYSKCIVTAATQKKCTDEIITLVALLNEENLLCSSKLKTILSNSKNDSVDCRACFQSIDGDLIMLLNLWKSYQANVSHSKKLGKSKTNMMDEWCHKYKVNISSWKSAIKARLQLIKILLGLGYQLVNANAMSSEQMSETVRRIMFHGLFANCAQIQSDYKKYITLYKKKDVNIHPSSCLFQKRIEFIFYTDVIETNRIYMRNVSKASIEWLKIDKLNYHAYFSIDPTNNNLSDLNNSCQKNVIYS